jgi:putative two-component system response regulator
MQTAERIALTHHEHWNGLGYPQGLKECEIPLEGRIVAVADAFDSMTNDRPYRRACSAERAVTEILRWRGTQFAPDVVEALCAMHVRGVLAPSRGVVRAADAMAAAG